MGGALRKVGEGVLKAQFYHQELSKKGEKTVNSKEEGIRRKPKEKKTV